MPARSLLLGLILASCSITAAAEPTTPEINRLIQQLGHDKFALREEASRGLITIGKPATAALAKSFSHNELEVQLRIAEILIALLNQNDTETVLAAFESLTTIAESMNKPAILRIETVLKNEKLRLRSEASIHFTILNGYGYRIQDESDYGRDSIKEVKRISLNGLKFTRKLTGNDLGKLRFFPELESLSITGTPVTDADLVHLRHFTKLQQLNLYGTNITNRGLRHLKGMTELRLVLLAATQINDAGLIHLKSMTQLEALNLSNTQVTDVGLKYLGRFRKLKSLGLRETQITDAGLKYLKEFKSLRSLSIGSSSITNAGLEHLKALSNLEILSLFETDANVRDLRKALPRLRRVSVERRNGTRTVWPKLAGS